MENQPAQSNRPSNPRRRKRTTMDKFKESYLPFIIVATSVLVILAIFISVATGSDPTDNTSGTHDRYPLLSQANDLLSRAEALAVRYEYDEALALLSGFEGNLDDYPKIKEAMDTYTLIRNSMVAWTAEQVPNLSFHTLIADLGNALSDPTYGQNASGSGKGKYNRNFITVNEFSKILQRLYEGDYVLVDLDDLYEYDASAQTYVAKQLLLPAGKKPLLLTQTHCNYYGYMEASDAFAAKLLHGEDGFYNTLTLSDGETVTGAFDLVPILEDFLQDHPDFSYRGARAILAFSGYDGIFGYRISKDGATEAEKADAAALVSALRETGYTVACYTYYNKSYAELSAAQISTDVQLWKEKIAPIVGTTDILVFAQEAADIGSYENNEKFDVLYEYGYRYFLGNSSLLFQETSDRYVRHNRLMVTASNVYYHGEWFRDILDVTDLLDSRRTNIAQ